VFSTNRCFHLATIFSVGSLQSWHETTSVFYTNSRLFVTPSVSTASHNKDSTQRAVDTGHCSEPIKDRLFFS